MSIPSHPAPPFPRSRRVILVLGGGFLLLCVVAAVLVRFHVNLANPRGIFFLEGKGRYLLEVKTDLYLGEANRLLASVDFGPLRRALSRWKGGEESPGLHLAWEEADGSGFVRQVFPDGAVLVTNFGRFVDDDDAEVHGLVVGGGLPESVVDGAEGRKSDTGMAFFDGKRWYHIWCNMNEAIHARSEGNPRRFSYPSRWRFLGSEVLRNGPHKVILSSSHATEVDGEPFRIDRYAYFNAGEPFFRLSIRITNEGSRPVDFVYLYGDEPWLGDYGSSAGNVGWVEGGIVQTVGRIDPAKYRYAGFWDNGNVLVSPRQDFTGVANFVEWLGPNRPDAAYFSNAPGYDPEEERLRVPLRSNTRFLGLTWGPRTLGPGREEVFFLAQGMAWNDPDTKVPVKPDVPLYAPLD